jgi:PKD repeat protein
VSGFSSNYEPLNHDDLPVAVFSYTPVSGKEPLRVVFTDASTPNSGDHAVTKWLWTFGDGETSTERNPIHVFSPHSTYNVVLQVSNDVGTGHVQQQVVATLRSTGSIVIDPLQSSIDWIIAFPDTEVLVAFYLGIVFERIHVTCAHEWFIQWTSDVRLHPSGELITTVGPEVGPFDALPTGGKGWNNYPDDNGGVYAGRTWYGPWPHAYGQFSLESCYPSGQPPYVVLEPGGDSAAYWWIHFPTANPHPIDATSHWPTSAPTMIEALCPAPWEKIFVVNNGYCCPKPDEVRLLTGSNMYNNKCANYLYKAYSSCVFTCTARDSATGDTDTWTSPEQFTADHLLWYQWGGVYP